jgi:alpha-L-fucosidase 2
MLLQSQDGAIHLLPALPGAWKKGSVNGLKARGGFEIEMKWEKGEISSAKIKSSLGGICRLRSYVPLKGNGLREARGQNPNPFFNTPETKKPLIHTELTSPSLSRKKVYEYDISTRKGDTIEINKL